MSSPTPPKKQILILGAGITALQTALSLLQSRTPVYAVTLIAAHLPGDLSIDYTSPWAGGFWRSHVGPGPADAEIRGWDQETLEDWMRLLDRASGTGGYFGLGRKGQEDVEKKVGLGVRQNVIFWSVETPETTRDGSGIWWRDAVQNFTVLEDSELRAVSARAGVRSGGGEKAVFGVKYDTVCINVPRYLEYMQEQVSALGGKFIRAMIPTEAGIGGVVKEMELKFLSSNSSAASSSPFSDVDIPIHGIVFATGLASKHFLAPEEASNLYPIRGQTVLVKGEAQKAMTHIFGGEGAALEDELTYIVPRPGSGCTIIGGCKQVGNYDAMEDKQLTKRILSRAKGMVPELLDIDGEFEIVSVQVGRRPGRKGGPRVELDFIGREEVTLGKEERKIEIETKIVWAYGHAGAGYQNSVGGARKVVRLLGDKDY